MGCVFYPGGIPDYFRLSKTEVPFAIPHKTKSKGALIIKTVAAPDCTDVFNKVPAWFSF